MKKLNKLFIGVLSICLIGSVVLTTSCTKDEEETYQYPSQVPALSTSIANGTFLTIDDYKINNNDLYVNLLQSYGVEELQNYVDYNLLKDYKGDWTKFTDNEIEADYQEYLENVKDSVDDNFELAMTSNGLHYTKQGTDTDYLYYDTYYRLEYKRYLKGLELFTTETAETNEQAAKDAEDDSIASDDKTAYVYEDEDIVDYFNNNYHKTYTVYLMTFLSENAALNYMLDHNAKVGDFKWVNATNGSDIDAAQIFKSTCEGKTYTYNELYALQATTTADGSIAEKITSMKAGEYTYAPIAFNGMYFLAYVETISDDYYNDADDTDVIKAADVKELDANQNATELSDTVMDQLEKDLIVSLFYSSSTTAQNRIDRAMFEMRQAAGLEIYAEGVEISYQTAFDEVYSDLDITDYEAFKATTNTSSTLIAKWNDKELSADTMFDVLVSRYGALVAVLYVQQYAVLGSKYNTVLNLTTGEVLDQDEYDTYFASDLTEAKESFNEGGFESYGYPVSYGWENFLRDYMGFTSEAAAVIAFNSSLYEAVEELYKKSLYMVELSDVTVTKQNVSGTEYYALESAKWNKAYVTDLKTADAPTTPTLTVAYSDADIENVEKGEDETIAKADYYGHFILTYNNGEKDVSVITDYTTDQLVMDKYSDLTNETFSATVCGLKAYYDKNNDGEADEFDQDGKKASVTEELVNNLTKVAENNYKSQQYYEKSFSTCLAEAVDAYKVEKTYSQYRRLNIKVETISSETYSNTTTQDDALKAQVKKVWEYLTTFTVPAEYTEAQTASIVSSVAGQSLDAAYRFVKDDEVFTVDVLSATHKADGKEIYNFANEYSAVSDTTNSTKVYVTKATAKTTSTSTQKPCLYYYEQSLLDSEDREVTLTCSSLITAYYTPAIEALASDTAVNKAILDDCNALLAKTSFSSDYSSLKTALDYIMAEAIKSANE